MEPPAVTPAGVFTVQHGLPPATPAPLDKSTPTPAPAATDLAAVWPRRVQWATALLLFLAVLLLAVHAVIVQPAGSRPAELQPGNALKYRIDLNKARRAELLQLPGIGPALAERIEEYRSEKGAFASVEELTKVRGIGAATLQRLRPFLCVNPGEFDDEGADPDTDSGKPLQRVSGYSPSGGAAQGAGTKKTDRIKRPIDINRASQTELQQLPGIGPKLSQRILDARQQRAFAKVDDLRRVPGIGVKTLEKLRPFVTVESH